MRSTCNRFLVPFHRFRGATRAPFRAHVHNTHECNLRNACTMIPKSANRRAVFCRSLEGDTLSEKGHNLTIAVSPAVADFTLEKIARQFARGGSVLGARIIIYALALNSRSGFPRAVKQLLDRWIPILSSCSPILFRFLVRAGHRRTRDARDTRVSRRHLLTKRARSLPVRRLRRPGLYATRTFAFVLTSPCRPFSPLLLARSVKPHN